MSETTQNQAPGIGPVAAEGAASCSGAVSSVQDSDLAPEGHAGPWQPTTIRDVEWALERIGEAEADIGEVQAQLAAAVAALNARAMTITERSNRRALWFRGLVEGWAAQHRDEVVRGKVKSRELLGGTIAFRAKGEKLEVRDRPALVAWLETQDPTLGLARVKLEPEMKAIQEAFRATGVIPPGCEHVPATETITVTAEPLPSLEATPKQKALKGES
jgi:phage host-nuclease inhibitor protein Gam